MSAHRITVLASCIVLVFVQSAVILPQLGPSYASEVSISKNTAIRPWLSNPVGTFNASGPIGSLMARDGATYIIAGHWDLAVREGNVTRFHLNFTEVEPNGEGRHTHSVQSFETNHVVPVILDRQGTTFTGESNIMTNGNVSWVGVQATVTIWLQDVITITFTDNDTEGHFNDERIYGIVEELRG